MRFGICVAPEHIATVAAAGFDFCELPARAVMPFDDDDTAAPALRAITAASIRPESFNVLIPGNIPLCGPRADLEVLRSYLRRAFSRMASLGAAIAVLGSGVARRIPDGWPRERALDQIADAVALAGDEAGRYGITLALEHLNRQECNVLNTVGECAAFILERGLRDVRLLADLHHIEVEHEPLEVVANAMPQVVHVHVAGGGRQSPDTPGYDYAGFMRILRAAGYDARISAECNWNSLADQAPVALAFMKAQWAGVGEQE
ncbi:MAG: sugar phosphate isomerase/epimerase family protein [Roseiflexaceae bacterium]|nr:sugar phosphate isomerase/epimerase family protein [Roseiflexaceae bacterium]